MTIELFRITVETKGEEVAINYEINPDMLVANGITPEQIEEEFPNCNFTGEQFFEFVMRLVGERSKDE